MALSNTHHCATITKSILRILFILQNYSSVPTKRCLPAPLPPAGTTILLSVSESSMTLGTSYKGDRTVCVLL